MAARHIDMFFKCRLWVNSDPFDRQRYQLYSHEIPTIYGVVCP